MNKPVLVIAGPVATRSGYGARTRDIAIELIDSDKYDVRIISLPWGSTPQTALNDDSETSTKIKNRLIEPQMNQRPDVFVQVTVPNEFQSLGNYNIGITAGIETTAPPGEWIEGCNKMDLVLVSSKHSKDVFESAIFDKIDEKTGNRQTDIKITTPIEVLFEGFNDNIYKRINVATNNSDIVSTLNSIKESDCYLFVGHWLPGGLGEDRKDVGMLIKIFCEAFKRKPRNKRPGLILKTSAGTNSQMDFHLVKQKINDILKPYGDSAVSVYLIHGDLSDDEMNVLYNHTKVKAMISITHGEGFGRPLLEFSAVGKPVIVSGWSGHLDFCKNVTLLPGQLIDVPPGAQNKFIINGTKWFAVSYPYVAQILNDCLDNYKKYTGLAKKQKDYVSRNFTLSEMGKKLIEYIDNKPANKLKLPKLKKVSEETQPKQIKLPKLKKITNE